MKKQAQYMVGIYCRLSKDDFGSSDSSSITSQKSMLEKYVKDNSWIIYDYYVDDGYSGTNYNRPAFERMIEDIEAGRINMVVVKDLSRLGRNYILTGQYTDIYFPDRNVRFIALNDGIDTQNNENSIVPFKNILNQMYSEDISKKVRSAVKVKKQKGEFLSNYAPYGYKKDILNKNKLVIDDYSAGIVRQIYEMCIAGNGSKKISKALMAEGVLSPQNYRNKQIDKPIDLDSNRWHAETINAILRNRIYLGDMVQGVYDCSRFKRTPNKRKSADEWIITPDTHEPIVSVELWEHAQTCLSSRKKVMKSKEVQLFAGFVKCADCGHALGYAYCQGIEQYTCGEYRRHGRTACTCHYIRKDTLEQVVLNDIRKYAVLANDNGNELSEHILSMNDEKDESQLNLLRKELASCQSRTEEINKIVKRLYEDNVCEKLSDERFSDLFAEYELEQLGIKKRIEEIQDTIQLLEENRKDSTAWTELIQNYSEIRELDRIVLSELIDKITVSETMIVDGEKTVDITIYYRFVGAIA